MADFSTQTSGLYDFAGTHRVLEEFKQLHITNCYWRQKEKVPPQKALGDAFIPVVEVIEVAHSATSTMLEKVKHKSNYQSGLQSYTIRSLDKPTATDIDQYKMLWVNEYPLKT